MCIRDSTNTVPEFVLNGFAAASNILPVMGFAMLLRLIYRKELLLSLIHIFAIRLIIRNRIVDGTYAAGTAIPSEHELSTEFDTTRLTVRNAIDLSLIHI